MKIILASGSPRRKELLELLQIPFEVIVSDFEESIDLNKPLEEEIKRLAYGKAKAVFENNQDSLVIGADTIVTINNKVLGKPKTNGIVFDDDYNSIIDVDDENLLKEVYRVFGRYSAWGLREMTHQETPWKETKKNHVISQESIKNYFIEHYVEA